MKEILLILIQILLLINCTSPPKPEEPCILIPKPAVLYSPKNQAIMSISKYSKKKLEEANPDTIIEKSNVVVKFLEDNKIEEHHQIIFRAENLANGNFYSSKNFIISLNEGQNLENIEAECEKMEKSDETENNICETSFRKLNDFYIFTYNFKLYNNEHIIVNYSYNITKSSPEILYRQESVIIPDYSKGFCNYTFIIPEGYINLGLQENKLTKVSENKYIYLDNCPSYSESDIIRFTPKETAWKAHIGIYSELTEGFTNDAKVVFPKYYQGGKINESYYRIFSLDSHSYKKSKILLDDLFFQINIPSKNKSKIGIDLYTAFTNNLYNKFDLNIPELYYEIDESKIDSTIKDKAFRTILDNDFYPGYPNYYKLGKFVNQYLTYNEKYTSSSYDMTPVEIYYLRTGASRHFTLLYNALLNAIDIKTLTIVGWAFKKGDISGYNSTFNHTWTAALIDGKWMELDATWGLFEGVSAGHILRSFYNDQVFYTFNENEGVTPLCEQVSSIDLILNDTDLEDPFPPHIDENIISEMTYIENKDSSENIELISTEKQDEIIVLTDYKYIDDHNSYIKDDKTDGKNEDLPNNGYNIKIICFYFIIFLFSL